MLDMILPSFRESAVSVKEDQDLTSSHESSAVLLQGPTTRGADDQRTAPLGSLSCAIGTSPVYHDHFTGTRCSSTAEGGGEWN